ncbi:hypothetical protein IL306_010172 [Fusarium sp. DS 682]|nr:hypothetical protein IL306_010172 [Fusarium sp. DS 682]
MLPKFRCNRCMEDLKSAFNLNEHQRADIICPRRSNEPGDERIDEGQERLLRIRKRKNGKTRQLSEMEKWIDMYKILFPHDDPIPSPYPDLCPLQAGPEGEQLAANVLDSFENFARQEFPRRMRPRMERLVDGILEQNLTSQAITDDFNNVLQGILQSFRAKQRQATCEPGADDSPSRSPSSQVLPAGSSPRIPQTDDDLESGLYSNLEIDLDEILDSLEDNQQLDFEHWQTETDNLTTFQAMGFQLEQYNRANA